VLSHLASQGIYFITTIIKLATLGISYTPPKHDVKKFKHLLSFLCEDIIAFLDKFLKKIPTWLPEHKMIMANFRQPTLKGVRQFLVNACKLRNCSHIQETNLWAHQAKKIIRRAHQHSK
jgi:hypothetical protein